MRVAPFLFYLLSLACTAQETSFFGIKVKVFICQCIGPETDLRCNTKQVNKRKANQLVKGPRAELGKCIARTKFDACRCSTSTNSTTNTSSTKCTTVKIPSTRLAAEVKKNNVNLGPCPTNNATVPVCKCSGPEVNLKCDTKFYTQTDAASAVNASNGTAVRGKCSSDDTLFVCCKELNANRSTTIKIPAPDVPSEVRKPAITFGACAKTNSTNSTNKTRFL